MMKRKGIWFLAPSILVLLTATLLSFLFSKESIHIQINQWHRPVLDSLFRIWTYLGDGLLVLIVVLIPVLIRIRYSLILFAAYAISGLTVQFMKLLLFRNAARPVKYFEIQEIDYELHLIPGVEMHHWHSFPSGHSATAFGVFFGLSLILNSRWCQLLTFIAAFGVAFSRIYLSQHFLMDVTAGAAIGLMGGYGGWLWISHYDRDWLNKSLPELLTR